MSDQTKKSLFRVSYPGNTLIEYGLVSLLVLGCAVLALKTLGFGLSDTFGEMLIRKSNTPVGVVSHSQDSQKSALQLTRGTMVRITLSSGSSLELAPYPENLAVAVTTVGANGTTDMLADIMQKMAAKMLADGSLSEEGYNNLTALSNQAHYIASIEKALEEAAAKAGSNQEFSSEPIQFNGKTYTAQELRMLIGYGSGSNDTTGITDHMNEPRAYPELKTFQILYQQALQNGALKDPAALQVVNTLANQVAYLSDVATSAAAKIIQQEIPPSDMLQSMAGDVTHSKSKGICHTGSGQDNGIQCFD